MNLTYAVCGGCVAAAAAAGNAVAPWRPWTPARGVDLGACRLGLGRRNAMAAADAAENMLQVLYQEISRIHANHE